MVLLVVLSRGYLRHKRTMWREGGGSQFIRLTAPTYTYHIISDTLVTGMAKRRSAENEHLCQKSIFPWCEGFKMKCQIDNSCSSDNWADYFTICYLKSYRSEIDIRGSIRQLFSMQYAVCTDITFNLCFCCMSIVICHPIFHGQSVGKWPIRGKDVVFRLECLFSFKLVLMIRSEERIVTRKTLKELLFSGKPSRDGGEENNDLLKI